MSPDPKLEEIVRCRRCGQGAGAMVHIRSHYPGHHSFEPKPSPVPEPGGEPKAATPKDGRERCRCDLACCDPLCDVCRKPAPPVGEPGEVETRKEKHRLDSMFERANAIACECDEENEDLTGLMEKYKAAEPLSHSQFMRVRHAAMSYLQVEDQLGYQRGVAVGRAEMREALDAAHQVSGEVIDQLNAKLANARQQEREVCIRAMCPRCAWGWPIHPTADAYWHPARLSESGVVFPGKWCIAKAIRALPLTDADAPKGGSDGE